MWFVGGRRKAREAELERELRNHLELEAEEAAESGMSADKARNAAHRALGNMIHTKEEVRGTWTWTRWEILMQDLRYAGRSLRKSPGFALTAILTLTLGIGASTTVFTLVDSVVLKPLAYRDSGSLVTVWERVKFLGDDKVGPNPRHWDLWKQRATAFTTLTLLRHTTTGVMLGTEHPVLVAAVIALPNLFDVLQVQPLLGRGFAPEDAVKGRDNVALLTYDLWQSMFHGDPRVVGTTVRMSNVPRQVIGVLPRDFHFPNSNALRSFESHQNVSGVPEPGVFLPASIDFSDFSWGGDYGNWVAIGRLRPGIMIGQADAQLNAIQAQIIEQMPVGERLDYPSGGLSAWVQGLQEAVIGDSKTALWLLMAAVIGLMMIACLNLANGQLGRALARRREAAMRAALGAARGRLVWNALAENLILAFLGGGGGALLAAGGLILFRRHSPVDLPRMAEVHLNFNVLLFSVALTVGAGVLCGMLPALRLLHTDPQSALQRNNNRAIGGSHSRGVRNTLIGLQVFGCTVLLLVTGLFSKSLLYLLHRDNGFDTGNVTVAEARLPSLTYEPYQKRVAFDDAILARLRAIPGVESAGLVSAMPLEGETWINGMRRLDRPNQQPPEFNLRWVSPGYFETTRQKIVAGRLLEERDRNLNSVILSESAARALWGSENPLGGQVHTGGRERGALTVIGVVADSHNTSLKSAPVRTAYLHYKDNPPFTTFFFARGALPAAALASSMRRSIWNYAPDITIARIKTMDSQVADSLAGERFQTLLLLSFGAAALLIAMLGIYGVLSYSVSVRRQEIGVRMALGASRSSIYRLTLFEASVPVLLGLAAGLAASLAAGNLIGKLLYGVRPMDASVILIVSSLFLLSAAAAGFLPARRAASVDPMQALRTE
jgi:predicted permease